MKLYIRNRVVSGYQIRQLTIAQGMLTLYTEETSLHQSVSFFIGQIDFI